jgi:signal transduction histidine kinase
VVIEIEYDPERAGGEREWTLGLSIAREIARAHGGDLAMSDSSSGRLFRVALPRTSAARAEGGRHAAKRPELEGRTA